MHDLAVDHYFRQLFTWSDHSPSFLMMVESLQVPLNTQPVKTLSGFSTLHPNQDHPSIESSFARRSRCRLAKSFFSLAAVWSPGE